MVVPIDLIVRRTRAAFVIVHLARMIIPLSCEEFETGLNIYSAVINVTYRDQATDILRWESDDNGRYGFSSRIEAEYGRVVHVRPLDNSQDCVPYVTGLTERWVALIDGSICKDLPQKIQNSPSVKNASAVIIYSNDESSELLLHSLRQKDDMIYVFVTKSRGDHLARLVNNGTRVFVHIQVGMLRTRYLSGINRTSMLFLSISFIVLMIISLAWLVFYYIQRSRYTYAKQRLSRRLMSAAKKAIGKMPLKTIHTGEEMEPGFDLCAVCIESYKNSEVVRILPCKHAFHKSCIDPWLVECRSCPICKIDILKAFGLQVCRSHESRLNIEADIASTSYGYSEFIPPDIGRDFDSDGVEIVRFQLAQIEYHCVAPQRQPEPDSDPDMNTSDETSGHFLDRTDADETGPAGREGTDRLEEPSKDCLLRTDMDLTRASSVRSGNSEDSAEGNEMQSLMADARSRSADLCEQNDQRHF